MSDILNLLQNDPLVFVVWVIVAVSLLLLFIFAIYFNFVPAKIASQYRQIRDRPIIYFGAIGIFIALLVIIMAMAFGSPKQSEETQETQLLKVYATVTKIDEKNSTLQVKDSTNGRTYQVEVDETTEISRGKGNAGLSDINIGEPITIETKKIPEKGNAIVAVEILLIPEEPNILTPGKGQ